MKCNLVPVIKD